MKLSTVIISTVAFVGFSHAATNTTTSTSATSTNAAVPFHGQDNVAAYGLGGAMVAGALAFLI